jgi:hypothetical protein
MLFEEGESSPFVGTATQSPDNAAHFPRQRFYSSRHPQPYRSQVSSGRFSISLPGMVERLDGFEIVEPAVTCLILPARSALHLKVDIRWRRLLHVHERWTSLLHSWRRNGRLAGWPSTSAVAAVAFFRD